VSEKNIERGGRKIYRECMEQVFLHYKEKEKWELTGRDGKSHIRTRPEYANT
jgi:hypothetical protein